tara:strand:- start:48 stop:260 length:213 start_codon:yes stop_codon:yes gene_type:complete
MKKNKTCRKGFHTWIEVDADVWRIEVCKKCGTYWDFDQLAWWEKLKWEIEDIIAHKQAKKWISDNWEPPF